MFFAVLISRSNGFTSANVIVHRKIPFNARENVTDHIQTIIESTQARGAIVYNVSDAGKADTHINQHMT